MKVPMGPLGRTSRLGIALVLLLTGCVTQMTEAELGQRIRNVSSEVPQRHAIRRFMPIYASTRMEAWAILAEARSDPESSILSRKLARGFALGQRKYVDYFVGSTYPALADRLILNGLTMNQGRSLRGLRVVLISSEAPSEALRTAALSRKVKLEHYPMP